MPGERTIYKSSISGRIVSKAYADANPRETFETRASKERAIEDMLRAIVETVENSGLIVTENGDDLIQAAKALLD